MEIHKSREVGLKELPTIPPYTPTSIIEVDFEAHSEQKGPLWFWLGVTALPFAICFAYKFLAWAIVN